MINYQYMHAHDDEVMYALRNLYRYRETIEILNYKINLAFNNEFQIKLDIKSLMNVKYIMGF